MTIRMPQTDREALAEHVRAAIAAGERVVHVMYEPGDMTHYEFVLAEIGPAVVATESDVHMLLMERGRWMLATDAFGCMTVDLTPGHYTDPTYVAGKLRSSPTSDRGLAMGSALVIAELLNMINGVDGVTMASMRETYARAFPPPPDERESDGEG